MRISKPEFRHSQDIYYRIIREHRDVPLRMAARLQEYGWDVADAAWVTLHWNKIWLAAAIADEREKRGSNLLELAVADPLRASLKTAPLVSESHREASRLPETSKEHKSAKRAPKHPKGTA